MRQSPSDRAARSSADVSRVQHIEAPAGGHDSAARAAHAVCDPQRFRRPRCLIRGCRRGTAGWPGHDGTRPAASGPAVPPGSRATPPRARKSVAVTVACVTASDSSAPARRAVATAAAKRSPAPHVSAPLTGAAGTTSGAALLGATSRVPAAPSVTATASACHRVSSPGRQPWRN